MVGGSKMLALLHAQGGRASLPALWELSPQSGSELSALGGLVPLLERTAEGAYQRACASHPAPRWDWQHFFPAI